MTALMALLWLVILLPISLDGIINVSAGHYDIRPNYFGLAAALVVAGLAWIKKGEFVARLREFLSRPAIIATLLFLTCGIIALPFSENPTRGLFFWIWTAGTLLALPLVIGWLRELLGWYLARSLALYFTVLCCVVVFDGFSCALTSGEWHLGRVLYEKVNDGALFVCRAFAWYQEPTYFAAFAIMTLVLVRVCMDLDHRWRWFWRVAFGLGLLSLVFAGSRMGWLGLLALVLAEAVIWCRGLTDPWFRRGWVKTLIVILVIGSVGYLARVPLQYWWEGIYTGRARALVDPANDAGFGDRFRNFQAAIKIFTSSPIVGVGAGGAGAYLAKHFPDDPWYRARLARAKPDFLKNDPVSYNIFGELLSEWGAVGLFVLATALFFYFRRLPWRHLLFSFPAFAVVTLTWQTLQRFDLWLVVFVLLQALENDIEGESSRFFDRAKERLI